MLDDYKDKQLVAYNIMMNEINNNKVSHAYLIDENNNTDSFNIVMAFVKEILTHFMDEDSKEKLCKRIDDNNYPEVKIIEPDGLLIKKGQILDLQHEFSMAAVEGNKRIYIIRNADAMRLETSNSMLKFLEEPENNIIAILMTNNINAILPTIVSRCQIIRLNNDNNNNNVNNDEMDILTLEFIKSIENNGIRTIINEQKLLYDKISIKDRENYIVFFDKMIDMYYDIMKINLDSLNSQFKGYMDDFKEIANKNSSFSLLKKIDYLCNAKDTIKNNVNMNLLIDSVIIGLGGIR